MVQYRSPLIVKEDTVKTGNSNPVPIRDIDFEELTIEDRTTGHTWSLLMFGPHTLNKPKKEPKPMTEQEWLTSNDPRRMLDALDPEQYGLTSHKFTCFINELLSKSKRWPRMRDDLPASRAWALACDLTRVVTNNPQNAAEQVAFLRDIFGNPFRPITIDPDWLAWRDRTVERLVQAIYDERAFDRLPILADALEEAGFTDPEILDHCRSMGPHVRGCWVVDLLLGKT